MNLGDVFWKRHCAKGRLNYHHAYEPIFKKIRQQPLRILEVGIDRGHSIRCWLDYFPNAEIYCIDDFHRYPPESVGVLGNERVHWFRGDSRTIDWQIECDIVIDDGCHTHESQRRTFENLFPYAKTYFIEDVWPFDKMTDKEKRNPYCSKPGFSDEEYRALMDVISPYNVRVFDLRNKKHPDAYIIEVSR